MYQQDYDGTEETGGQLNSRFGGENYSQEIRFDYDNGRRSKGLVGVYGGNFYSYAENITLGAEISADSFVEPNGISEAAVIETDLLFYDEIDARSYAVFSEFDFSTAMRSLLPPVYATIANVK